MDKGKCFFAQIKGEEYRLKINTHNAIIDCDDGDMTQEESDSVLYALNILSSAHIDCKKMTFGDKEVLWEFLYASFTKLDNIMRGTE